MGIDLEQSRNTLVNNTSFKTGIGFQSRLRNTGLWNFELFQISDFDPKNMHWYISYKNSNEYVSEGNESITFSMQDEEIIEILDTLQDNANNIGAKF